MRLLTRAIAAVAAITVSTAGVTALTSGTAQAAPGTVVISQVYGGGGNTGAPLSNDFVELFNRGTAPVSIDGWSIQYTSATGTGLFSGAVTGLTGTIAPGAHYLVGFGTGLPGTLPATDASGGTALSASAGKVALVGSATGLACNGGSTPCAAEQSALIADLVGYGTANYFEGTAAAPPLSNTTAALRASGGCADTDDNAADFTAGTPAPRNSATPAAPCGDVEPSPSPSPRVPFSFAQPVAERDEL